MDAVELFITWATETYGAYKQGMRKAVERFLEERTAGAHTEVDKANSLRRVKDATAEYYGGKQPPGIYDIRKACFEAGVAIGISKPIVSSTCQTCGNWCSWAVGVKVVCPFCGSERFISEDVAKSLKDGEKRWSATVGPIYPSAQKKNYSA